MEYSIKEQEIRNACNQFLPDKDVQSYRPIETGHINHTYQVTLSDGGNISHYLLQNLNTNVFTRPEVVTHNIVRCATFLKNKCPDYPYEILTPLATKGDERYLLKEGQRAWRMFDFISDAKSLDQISTADEASKIGKAFGVFLSYINNDDPEKYQITIPDFHNFTKRYRAFKNYLARLGEIKDEKVTYLISRIDHYAYQFLELEQMEFPSRIIHHDTKANNVLLDKKTGHPKCIIDLDTLMPGDIFSDFGDLMRTVLNPYEEDKFPENGNLIEDQITSSLISGFLSPLNEILRNNEKEYLITGGKKITLLQVLRFLEDHLKGDVYYQIEYIGHNLDRALSQMFLYESMEQSGIAIS